MEWKTELPPAKTWVKMRVGEELTVDSIDTVREAMLTGDFVWADAPEGRFILKRCRAVSRHLPARERVMTLLEKNGGRLTLGVLSNKMRSFPSSDVADAADQLVEDSVLSVSRKTHRFTGKPVVTYVMKKPA